MPRGRHRHAPPLHRLIAPSAIAAAAFACAGGAWLAGDTGVARGFGLGAAAAAVASATLLRHWDRLAGRQVAETRAAKANLEWRAEERQAELEADLEESRDIRGKLEDKLRERRTELDRLRSEHAALLRRYATAETERASALEGRRQLAIASAEPAKELTTGAADHRNAAGAPTPLTYLQANEAMKNLKRNAVRQQEQAEEAKRIELAERVVEEAEQDLEGGEVGFDFFAADSKAAAEAESPPAAGSPADAGSAVDATSSTGVASPADAGSAEEAESSADAGGADEAESTVGAESTAEAADGAEPEIPRQPVRRPPNAAGKVIDLAEPA